MFKFITNKPLWVNIIAGLVLALLIFSGFILSLSWFTNHGDSKTVPPVLGKTLPEAQKILEKAGFDIEIADSVYVDSLKPLEVLRQVPDEYEVVKSSRTVYLTINRAVPPLVEMPNIVGYSFRNAELVLKNLGLKVGDTTYRPDFAKNSVLEQNYNGAPILPGAKLRMGSSIGLVIGNGLGNAAMAVPSIVGMTYAEAKTLIEGMGLSFAVIIAAPDVKDTASSYINRQSPEKFDVDGKLRLIRQGQTMDIWLSLEKPAVNTSGGNSGADSSGKAEETP